jgi:hypothetical protein
MVQAGASPNTTWAYVSELQRELIAQKGGAFGEGLLWEWYL